ncbi:MAG TPA: helix-turn-helix domain-containing protein [Jiangellaceae bacterium]
MRIDKTALDGAAARVGDRWSLRVIAALFDGDKTFGELSEEVSGIAPNILAARLRALERDALISSRPYQHRPVRMRYSLTTPGRRLADAVALLAEWGSKLGGESTGLRHETCGTSLELRPWCLTCETVAEPGSEGDLVWV